MGNESGTAVRSMSAEQPPETLFKSEYDGPLTRGRSGEYVKRLQQWLCLREHCVEIDGEFGRATENALMAFQASQKSIYHMLTPGVLDECTWRALEEPLRMATTVAPDVRSSISELIIKCASQHIKYKPRELKSNAGPWVRYYTRGNEGPAWAWCAGYVSAIIYQAYACAGKSVTDYRYATSCDLMMEYALAHKQNISRPVPGCVFTIRKSAHDWIHTGIVMPPSRVDVFYTSEGNSNNSGSREGTEVCELTRFIGERYDFFKVGG